MRRLPWSMWLAGASGVALYAVLASGGDLRENTVALVAGYVAGLGLMAVGWRLLSSPGPTRLRAVLLFALLFRLVASWGGPALSDDLYRYHWDGRVQWAGEHPYRYAPDAPELDTLRDDDWARINHRDVPTIYPPLAQIFFLLVSAAGLGPGAFQLAAGLLDFGVVLALLGLLRQLETPVRMLVLYAWNPLAVLETAGSGHLEPLGVLLLLVALRCGLNGAWGRAAGLLAAATQVKLLPVVLMPPFVRRLGWRIIPPFGAVLVLPWLPYALTGPAFGSGLLDYAARWEFNALIYPAVLSLLEWLEAGEALKAILAGMQRAIGGPEPLWNALYGMVWPRELTRVLLALAAIAVIAQVSLRRRFEPANAMHDCLLAALLLSPTLHPWYVLWVLPLSVACRRRAVTLFACLVPIAYLAGDGPVPWWMLAIEYAPLLWALHDGRRSAAAVGESHSASIPG